jgi:hypothetical protein
LPVFLLNLKGDTEIALKQREGSALRYRYLRLFGIPVIHISKSFIADLGKNMKLILFDIDGTLIDSGGAGTRSLDLAFKELFSIDNIAVATGPYSAGSLIKAGTDIVFEDLSDTDAFLKAIKGV